VPGERAFEKFLTREQIVDDARLTEAREEAERTGVGLVDVLLQKGYASQEEIYRALARFCEMRFVVPSKLDIQQEVVEKVPARYATHYNFVPVQERNGTLVVAISDPLNGQLIDDIRLVMKQRVEPVVATPDEIGETMKTLYGVGAGTVERILSDAAGAGAVVSLDTSSAGADLGDENIDASIIKFVNELIAEAIRTSATDIHIEPFENQLRVRYRIDGVLHGVPTPPSIRGFQSAIVSRIKIMANLNIAEKRLPQDGKFMASMGDEQYDLRVSILPTPHGETVNMRILTRSSMFLTLEQLGFLPEDLKLFNSFLRKPHGMILVTGPTGSGKTTTLYAALAKLNSLESKIITIEEPIEYQLRGITQVQTVPQIGFDFASALRHFLRHDPDIMMVGEIRDFETAEMAIRSSLTGHLVFSTLHTNDAPGAVTRLIDMGVEPFLISSTMIASVAQRLVRRICPNCAEPYEPDQEMIEEFRVTPEMLESANFKRGAGCEMCRYTGYKGRIAIYEILPFWDVIKQMTVQRAPSTEIKRKACEMGMRTLRESGWLRVKQGLSTFEEVLRVTADTEVGFEAERKARSGEPAGESQDAPVPV
jgi:type II secretion system protein E